MAILTDTPRVFTWVVAIFAIVAAIGIIFQIGSSFGSRGYTDSDTVKWTAVLQVQVPLASTNGSLGYPPPGSVQGTHTDPACASDRDQRLREAAEEWAVGAYNNVSEPQHGYAGSLEWRPYIEDPNVYTVERADMPYARGVPPGPLARVDILFYGDSLDRYLIDDGCAAFGGKITDWANDIIKYKDGSSASAICTTSWGTFAFVHLYGSAPTGPYLHGHVNNADDPYTDTPLRIRRTWEHYKSKFGVHPNIVVYQSNLWDVYRYREVAARPDEIELDLAYNRTLKYIHDMGSNIDLLRSLLPENGTLLLRTTPTNNYPAVMQAQFTAAMRVIGKRLCVPVLDWDTMISRLRLQEVGTDMWRDITHVTARHSAAFLKSVIDFVQLHVLTQS